MLSDACIPPDGAPPRSPGRYALRYCGRVRWYRVREINGELYAIRCFGLIATRVDRVDGEWLVAGYGQA